MGTLLNRRGFLQIASGMTLGALGGCANLGQSTRLSPGVKSWHHPFRPGSPQRRRQGATA